MPENILSVGVSNHSGKQKF